MHEDKSNSMNSSAFCWALSGSVLHPDGKSAVGLSGFVAPEMWMSLSTTRPQTSASAAPTGAVNDMYSTAGLFALFGFVVVIHERPAVVTLLTSSRASKIGSLPLASAPCLPSQSDIAWPFGNAVEMS